MLDPTSKISDLILGDSQAGLMSLQFLDDIIPSQSYPQFQCIQRSNTDSYQHEFQNQVQLFEPQKIIQQFMKQQDSLKESKQICLSDISQNCRYQNQQNQNKSLQNQMKQQIKQSNINIKKDSQVKLNDSKIEILNDLNFQIQGRKTQQEALSKDLCRLKQLQEKSIAEVHSYENSQQIKQNFQALFQKVYGIIEQIQSRNQKSEMARSQAKNNLSNSCRKQLKITPKVIQLSVNKENSISKKKFYNLHTQFDYTNDIYDEKTSVNQYIRTEQNCPRTPFNSTRAKQTNQMILSKQLPFLASPKASITNTARSDRSNKSKGLTLVSADKKLQNASDVKKSIKITLVQKKIVPCPTKRIQLQKSKVQKKVNSFNPSNFFSSRRVSTRII